MNLIAPCAIMQDIARSSRPENLQASGDKQGRFGPVAGWWACMVVGGLALLWSRSKMSGADGPEEMLSATQLNIFADLLMATAVGLSVMLVNEESGVNRPTRSAFLDFPGGIRYSEGWPGWISGHAEHFKGVV